MSKKRTIILSAMLVLVASLVAMSTVLDWYPAARASTIGSKQALIHGPSVSGSPSEEETWAIGAGFVVTVVTGPTWTAMPTTGPGANDSFDDFQVLIIGDPGCFAMPESATANFASWAPAVMGLLPSVNTLPGNRILIGTDPVNHSSQGGSELILRGIIFAGYQKDRTGVYFNMSCGNNSTGLAALTALSSTGSPAWTINNLPPCGGTVALIATAPALTPLTSNDLQGWQCSVHETFPSFPSDWRALALATDSSLSPAVCGTDTVPPACGEPYILVAGKGIVVCSKGCISLSPLTATNPPGTAHKVTATVTEPGGLPLVGELITFEVDGINETAAGTCVPVTCLTDSRGQVSFTYSDDHGCGEDFISASYAGFSGGEATRFIVSAAKEWTCEDDEPPTSTVTPTATPTGATATVTPYVPRETPPIITHPNCKPARLVGGAGWQTMAPPPDGVEGGTGVIIGSKLYATHGLIASLTTDSAVVMIYNLLTDVWTTGVPADQKRSELVGVCANRGGSAKVFAIGGRYRAPPPALGVVLDTVEMYDTDGPLPSGPPFWTTMNRMITARAGLGAVTDPRTNIIYAIGGRTGDSPHEGIALDVVEAFNPNGGALGTWSANTWSPAANAFTTTIPLDPLPVPMMGIYSTVYFEGNIYVIGGFDGTSVSDLVQIYDINANTWSMGARMPTPRSNLIAGVCRGRIYAIGGSTNLLPTSPIPPTNLDTNEVYDPVMNVWATAPMKPTAASEMSSAAISTGEEIFAIGSGLRATFSAVNEVFTCAKPPTPTPSIATATPTATPSATPTATPEKPCGDVNDDGQVNSVDANLILQLEAGFINTLPNLPSADVNGDGVVNSLDSNFILQFVVGFIPSLSC